MDRSRSQNGISLRSWERLVIGAQGLFAWSETDFNIRAGVDGICQPERQKVASVSAWRSGDCQPSLHFCAGSPASLRTSRYVEGVRTSENQGGTGEAMAAGPHVTAGPRRFISCGKAECDRVCTCFAGGSLAGIARLMLFMVDATVKWKDAGLRDRITPVFGISRATSAPAGFKLNNERFSPPDNQGTRRTCLRTPTRWKRLSAFSCLCPFRSRPGSLFPVCLWLSPS